MNERHHLGKRDALEFIVSEIADEAVRAGKPLTDVERRMLFFEESAPGAHKFADVLEAFDRDYDESQYEHRIAGLIRTARKRADRSKAPVLTSIAGLLLFMAGLDWYLGHAATKDEQFFYFWVAIMSCAALYQLGRWTLGAERVDGAIGRVIDAVSGARKKRG